MSNRITVRPPSKPAPMAPQVAEKLSRALTAITFGEMKSADSPSEHVRRLFNARVGVITCALAPAAPGPIAKLVGALLAGFDKRKLSTEEAAVIVSEYVLALEGMPHWAVEEACQKHREGSAGSLMLAYAPTPPELRKTCAALVADLARERHQIEKVLGARVRAPEEEPRREVMGEKLRALAAELAAGHAMEAPKRSPVEQALAEGDLDGAKAAGRQVLAGVELSPHLRARMGLDGEDAR